MDQKERINAAIKLAIQWGGVGGDHHKAWVIDQMLRMLAGDDYGEIIREANDGEDGLNTYEWDVGIPP